MKTYLIGYDLDRPGQNYPNLAEAIQRLGPWCHGLDSTWIVKSDWTATQMREYLSTHIDQNDKLLVALLAGEAAWVGFAPQCSSWLEHNL